LALFCLSTSFALTPTVITYGGQVRADHDTSKPLSQVAHVFLSVRTEDSRTESATTLTDLRGQFIVSLPASHNSEVTLVVRSDGYAKYEMRLRPESGQTRLAVSLIQEDRTDYKESRSLVWNSGRGADFSPAYQICSPPARQGFVVRDYAFTLTGDRSCGSWST